ncbi:MAG TPA: TolC family protein [Acidobacteriaceae bacterium]|nr:TolC family protein [Acidobacteriaceae bacterium]
MIRIKFGSFGFLLVTLFAAGMCATAQATPPLTMQQAVAMALANNPSLIAARQNVLATKAQEITAGLRQNPDFTLSGSDVSLPADNPASPYSYSTNVSRLFERGQKRRWRLDIARDTTAVTQSQYKDTERQTILQVRESFTNMLAAKAALQISGDNLTSYRKTVDLTHVRLNAGDISETDFERIDLQQAEFESDYETAKLNVTQASDQLQVLLGIPKPSAQFDITGNLTPPSLTITQSQLEQDALTARPDYLAAVQSVQLADANIKMAYANGTVDPTLGGEYERSGTYNSAGFQLSIPLRIFDRNQGAKQSAKYAAESSRSAEISARNQVISDVDQAWAGYEAALNQARRYHGHYLDEATHVRDNLEYSYRHGGASLLDYLDALRDYRQINLDALNADQQVWTGLDQLSYAAATEILP